MHNIFFDSIEPEPAFSWWWNWVFGILKEIQ
jgi:hypothetical protein